MSELDLDAIKARANAASSGPWSAIELPPNEHYDRPAFWVDAGYDEASGTTSKTVADCLWSMADAEFIAHARQDVGALLAEVKRLRAVEQRMRDLVTRLRAKDEIESDEIADMIQRALNGGESR